MNSAQCKPVFRTYSSVLSSVHVRFSAWNGPKTSFRVNSTKLWQFVIPKRRETRNPAWGLIGWKSLKTPNYQTRWLHSTQSLWAYISYRINNVCSTIQRKRHDIIFDFNVDPYKNKKVKKSKKEWKRHVFDQEVFIKSELGRRMSISLTIFINSQKEAFHVVYWMIGISVW